MSSIKPIVKRTIKKKYKKEDDDIGITKMFSDMKIKSKSKSKSKSIKKTITPVFKDRDTIEKCREEKELTEIIKYVKLPVNTLSKTSSKTIRKRAKSLSPPKRTRKLISKSKTKNKTQKGGLKRIKIYNNKTIKKRYL